MPAERPDPFTDSFPRCFVVFLGIVELLCVIVFILTELGNVAANFWTTNVFAGGWCGLIMLIHFFGLFVAGCCSPKQPAAFRACVISVIGLLACGVLIGFDAYFIAKPTTCILTSSCVANSVSTTIFSYSFRSNFFSVWNSLSPFKSYTESQTKFLFQTVQLSVGCLCFVLCLIFIIIYYVTRSKASEKVSPSGYAPPPHAPQPAYRPQQQYQGGQSQYQSQSTYNRKY